MYARSADLVHTKKLVGRIIELLLDLYTSFLKTTPTKRRAREGLAH